MRLPSKRVSIAIATAVGVVIIGAGVLAVRNYATRPGSGAALSHRPTATASPTATETLSAPPGGSPTSTATASGTATSNPTGSAREHSVPNLVGAGAALTGYDWGHGYPLLVSTDMQAGGVATWKWDGTGWVRLQPQQPPPFVPFAGPVYDPRPNQTVVLDGQGMLGWNGSTWSDLHVTTPSNCGAQVYLALDALRQLLVMLCQDSPTTTTTWLFDGTRWRHGSGANNPPPRTSAGFAWFRANGEMVLFGGRDMSGKDVADTWVFNVDNGEYWTQLHPAVSPPGGAGSLAFDSTSTNLGELVLLQQPQSSDPNSVDSEWTWDGGTWTNRGTGPPPGPLASLVDDPAHQDLLLFEGFSDQKPGSQTWHRVAGAWSRIG